MYKTLMPQKKKIILIINNIINLKKQIENFIIT
jgi:hypothetical protein